MEEIVNSYYKDNAQKLHREVDKILSRFGGLSNKDLDDFYSLANEVFVDAMRRYDETQSFDAFLYSCLFHKIKSEMTRRNRRKRQGDRRAVSIDTPVSEDEDTTIGDMLAADYTIERELFEEKEEGYSKRMLLYLSKLSTLQKDVLKLSMAGYHSNEIKDRLHISEKQYTDCCAAIHSYRNISILIYAADHYNLPGNPTHGRKMPETSQQRFRA